MKKIVERDRLIVQIVFYMLILCTCKNLDIFKEAEIILLLIFLKIQKFVVSATGFAINIFILT